MCVIFLSVDGQFAILIINPRSVAFITYPRLEFWIGFLDVFLFKRPCPLRLDADYLRSSEIFAGDGLGILDFVKSVGGAGVNGNQSIVVGRIKI